MPSRFIRDVVQHSVIGMLAFTAALAITSRAHAEGPAPARCKDFQISLRSDFNDLNPLKCPEDYAAAQGGSVSLGYNTLTSQGSAGLDGLLAATRYFDGVVSEKSPFMGATVGVFAQASDTYLFQPTPSQSTNSDTLTAGAFTQIALNNTILRQGYDVFRLRGGYVQASTGAYFYSYVAEWFPTYGFLGQGVRLFNTPINSVFTAELIAQYDRFGGGPNKYVIFADGHQDLRIGPQALLQLSLDRLFSSSPTDMAWASLAPWSALISAHTSWDDYTGRNFYWASASVTYTFGTKAQIDNAKAEAGHIGVTLSYGYGNSETTGNLMSQVKLGLSAKF
jgi:hypothetical protein